MLSSKQQELQQNVIKSSLRSTCRLQGGLFRIIGFSSALPLACVSRTGRVGANVCHASCNSPKERVSKRIKTLFIFTLEPLRCDCCLPANRLCYCARNSKCSAALPWAAGALKQTDFITANECLAFTSGTSLLEGACCEVTRANTVIRQTAGGVVRHQTLAAASGRRKPLPLWT